MTSVRTNRRSTKITEGRMSTKYRESDQVPTHILAERLSEIADMVVKADTNVFQKRIPAELDYDPDLVLTIASHRLGSLAKAEKAWFCVGVRSIDPSRSEEDIERMFQSTPKWC